MSGNNSICYNDLETRRNSRQGVGDVFRTELVSHGVVLYVWSPCITKPPLVLQSLSLQGENTQCITTDYLSATNFCLAGSPEYLCSEIQLENLHRCTSDPTRSCT